MEIIQAVISGIVQGTTELLPVSSSGHLLLLSQLTEQSLELPEIAILHLGTLASIVIAMKDKLREILNTKMLINILISIVPAGITGIIIEEILNIKIGSPSIIVFSLIFWGIVLIFVDQFSRNKDFKTQKLKDITPLQSAAVGIGQCLALIPGTSRSGITTITGIIAGISPETSLHFSFLSGIPLITASGLYGSIKFLSRNEPSSMGIGALILATLISFVVGVFAAQIFKRFIKRRILTMCGIYRIILGIAIIIFLR